MIELFSHNQAAYESLLSTLEAEGKACIIHPTGTGKSFIGFKYCEDHPEERILWLSPSEYIFKTQCENLAATGADVPENITFLTYAKLSILSEDELRQLRPDTQIEDEFHRIGAQTWGMGVHRLCRLYPEAKRIGLSATSIRYLDQQRDMGKEEYDSCIASEMSLGEAITRGILHAPRYVLTSFGLEAGLKKYESRVRRAKSAAVRNEGERLLEALRRALEKADGLDTVFRKHLTNTTGKYLVFCANVEHMREMMSHVPEWFGKLDPEAHVYYAYADDPGTSRAFREFKADTSEHLKLLFTIDMLNEGIHVEDVSGVILFRPTVSPIIYKQQIGRALSASGAAEPVILDVVNNIENLYSIGAIEQEMRDAMYLLRDRGEGEEIIVDRFNVIDELRDARELFSRLDETLSVPWDAMFVCAKQFYEEHGHLEVPRGYRTAEGYALWQWISTQRQVRRGTVGGTLDERRIALLDSIGMVWEGRNELSWKQYFDALCRYKAQHGDIDVKSSYKDENGLALGAFVANLRSARRDGKRSAYLTAERIRQLDDLGMIWDRLDYGWEQNYQACAKYYLTHGNLNIPNNYVQDGLKIGAWLRRQRMLRDQRIQGSISPEHIHRLDEIGMVWTDAYTAQWEYGYRQAEEWYTAHGDLNVPTCYVNERGFPLGMWLKRHVPDEKGKTKIKITPEKKAKLDALGMAWERPEDSWEVRFSLAKAYFDAHGDLNIPAEYKADGIWLSKWLNEQRQIYNGKRPGKRLTEDQIQCLEAIGMTWENRNHQTWSRSWQQQYEEARDFFRQHGDLKIPGDYLSPGGKKLGIWLRRQRALFREGKLPQKQIMLLTDIGMEWELEDAWETGFIHAVDYSNTFGNLDVKSTFVCEDGYRLGGWISNQRANHNHPSKYHYITSDQARRLEAIGMVWNPSDEQWMEGFRHAKVYMAQLNGLPFKTNYVSEDGYKTGSWIRGQCRAQKKGSLSMQRENMLNSIGVFTEDKTHGGNPSAPSKMGRPMTKENLRTKQGDQSNAAI